MKSFKFALLAVLLSSCGQPETDSEPLFDESLEPYASAFSAIGLPDGRMLNFVCMGSGSPTVILTAGMGDFTGWAWSTVQADMSKTTKVCAWDRPGFGLSDGSAAPQTVATTTADLEAALATGKLPPPYVMVGHSVGAYESLLFADRHPEQVVGMVLIDPSFPGQFSTAQPGPPPPPGAASLEDSRAVLRQCATDIRSGKLRYGTIDPHKCLAFPLSFPRALGDALKVKVLRNPLQYESQLSFNTSGAESSEQVVNPRRDYGAMPLIVLSAVWEPPFPPGTSEELKTGLRAEHSRTDRGHQELAALSTRGLLQRVTNADHYIQKSQPRVVVDAVSNVVRQSRAR